MWLKCQYPIFLILLLFSINQNGYTQFSELKVINNGLDSRDTAEINALFKKAILLSREFPDSAVSVYKTLLDRSRRSGYTKGIIGCCVNLAGLKTRTAQYVEAAQYLALAKANCNSLPFMRHLVNVYGETGCLYFAQSHYESAIKENMKAIALGEKIKHELLPTLYANTSMIFQSMRDIPKARIYLEKALSLARRQGDDKTTLRIFINKARTWTESTEYESAVKYLDSAAVIAHAYQWHTALIQILGARMELHNHHKVYHNSLALLPEALKLMNKNGISPGSKNIIHNFAAQAYRETKNYPEAKKHLEAAKKNELFLTLNNRQAMLHEYSSLLLAMGDYKRAYEIHQEVHLLDDSLKRKEIAFNASELETQYRTAEKDKEIAQNRLQLTEKDNALRFRNIWLGIFGGGSLLLAGFFLVIYRNVKHKQRLQLTQQENIRLKALMEGEERERNRIAVELHDGIGGLLSAAKMSLSSVPIPSFYQDKQDQGLHLLDEASKELRRSAHNLSPEILRSKGLVEAVSIFCQKTALARQIRIDFESFGSLPSLKEGVTLSLYRMIQELLQNVVKHAQATEAMVQISLEEDLLNIIVEDNGIGMQEPVKDAGIGLHHLQSRVKALNGSVDIDTRIHEGTTVYLKFSILALQNEGI